MCPDRVEIWRKNNFFLTFLSLFFFLEKISKKVSTIFEFFLIFSKYFGYFTIFIIISRILTENTSVNTKIIIIFMKKSLILINNSKKNSPAAGTLPGDSLSGEQSPTARCAGAKLRRKNMKFYKILCGFRLF